ncbi:MAG: isocitrate lyase/phosphoenolpyruvate mutase family protein [Sphingomonas sp.]
MTFAALHVPGDPVVLFNVWDAGSAEAVARAGAKAVATGSASVGPVRTASPMPRAADRPRPR